MKPTHEPALLEFRSFLNRPTSISELFHVNLLSHHCSDLQFYHNLLIYEMTKLDVNHEKSGTRLFSVLELISFEILMVI